MTDKRFTNTDNGFIVDYESKQKVLNLYDVVELLNELHEENDKIKSLLLKKVEELIDAYNKSARAGMPTGGIIGELDTLEEICEIMGWIE